MNLKRLIYTVLVMLGQKPKLAYIKFDKPVFKAGLQYAWSGVDPDDLCQLAKDTGVGVLSCELGERYGWDMKINGPYIPWLIGRIDKIKKLQEACKFWKIWLEVIYNNSNADYNEDASLPDLVHGANLVVDALKLEGMIYVPVSEFDSDLHAKKRAAILATFKQRVPSPHLVLMMQDTGNALHKEHHIQKPDGLVGSSLSVENCTDSRSILNWLNADGVDGEKLNVDRAADLAMKAKARGTTFELYGFWKKLSTVKPAWARCARIYK